MTDPLTSDPLPAPRRGPRRHLVWLGTGAAVIALATGGSAALAASAERPTTAAMATADDTSTEAPAGAPGRGPRGPHGTVTAVDGSTLTVETEDGTAVTVETTDDTTVTEASEGAVSDLAVGDNVTVRGESTDSGVTARGVTDHGDAALPERPADAPEPPEGADRRGVAGTIASVDGATFTVTTAEGETVTVTTDDETDVVVVSTLAVADIEVGDTVGIRAPQAADGAAVTAEAIRVGELPEGAGRGPGGPGGRGGPRGDCDTPEGGAPDGEAPAGETPTTEAPA